MAYLLTPERAVYSETGTYLPTLPPQMVGSVYHHGVGYSPSDSTRRNRKSKKRINGTHT